MKCSKQCFFFNSEHNLRVDCRIFLLVITTFKFKGAIFDGNNEFQ